MDMEHPAIQVELADFLAVKMPWCKTKPSSYCTTEALGIKIYQMFET